MEEFPEVAISLERPKTAKRKWSKSGRYFNSSGGFTDTDGIQIEKRENDEFNDFQRERTIKRHQSYTKGTRQTRFRENKGSSFPKNNSNPYAGDDRSTEVVQELSLEDSNVRQNTDLAENILTRQGWSVTELPDTDKIHKDGE